MRRPKEDTKLASVILNSTNTSQAFLTEINAVLKWTRLTEKEFLNEFQSLKTGKSPGFGDLTVNIIKFVYVEIKASLCTCVQELH